MQQGLKTVKGKSKMLPLYQDKKRHVFSLRSKHQNQVQNQTQDQDQIKIKTKF